MTTFTPAKTAFARIGQSFSLVFQNLILLLGVAFGTYLIIDLFVLFWGSNQMQNLVLDMSQVIAVNIPWAEMIFNLLIVVLVAVIGGIVASLSMIYAVSELHKGNKPSLNAIFNYAIGNLVHYFSVVWNVFVYTSLIPVLILLLGGVLIVLGQAKTGFFVLSIGGLVMAIFQIMRSPRAFAALYIAVDENKKGHAALESSIQLTQSRWWQTIGNFLLIMIVIILVSWVIAFLLGTIGIAMQTTATFLVNNIIRVLIKTITQTFFTGLTIVFSYLLFLSYKTEAGSIDIKTTKEK